MRRKTWSLTWRKCSTRKTRRAVLSQNNFRPGKEHLYNIPLLLVSRIFWMRSSDGCTDKKAQNATNICTWRLRTRVCANEEPGALLVHKCVLVGNSAKSILVYMYLNVRCWKSILVYMWEADSPGPKILRENCTADVYFYGSTGIQAQISYLTRSRGRPW